MDRRAVQAGGGGVRGALLRPLLAAGALGWGAAQALKAWAYRAGVRRARRLPVPVISVGNLVAGGTGKTPFVAWLVERLRERGRTPGVLSRGYGPRVAGGLSDEGAVLEHLLGPGLPQAEDPDRVRGGRSLLDEHPEVDVLVLDDGFQHRRIHRDLDVVLLDATNPFGFGRLLPRGLLRERPSALARAGAVVLTRAELVDRAARDAILAEVRRLTQVPVCEASTRAVSVEIDGAAHPPSVLRGEDVWAVGGLGNFGAFLASLSGLGAKVVGATSVRDHRYVSDAVLGALRDGSGRSFRWIVATRKDAVKRPPGDGRLAILDVATEVAAPQPLLERVEAALAAAPRTAAAPGAPGRR
jgi:tetraacyldisaccharide 4'-kinase